MSIKTTNIETFEKILSKIRIKRWGEIRSEWTRYIPNIPEPGCAPTDFLENQVEFQLLVSDFIKDGGTDIERDLPTLRPLLLWEAIYYLHKANHILAAAEIHVKEGLKSWSLSSAYHSSLFAAKSIINLWGISLPKFSQNNKSYLLDVFHEPNNEFDKTRKIKIKKFDHVLISASGINYEVQHKHIWNIFLRLLSVTHIEILPEQWTKLLKRIEPSAFSKQRNYLHYHHYWLFEDLFEFIYDEQFGYRQVDLYKGLESEDRENDFSLILAHVLVRCCYMMLRDISASSVVIEKETILMKSLLLNPVIHPLHARIKEYEL